MLRAIRRAGRRTILLEVLILPTCWLRINVVDVGHNGGRTSRPLPRLAAANESATRPAGGSVTPDPLVKLASRAGQVLEPDETINRAQKYRQTNSVNRAMISFHKVSSAAEREK